MTSRSRSRGRGINRSLLVLLLLLFLLSIVGVTTAQSSAGDSTCSTGIPHSSGGICCAASCGTCGGAGCGGREGGSSACCGRIRDDGNSCLTNPPPCVIDLPVRIDDPINPFCASTSDSDLLGTNAGGIRDTTTGVCCAETCGSCGNDDVADADGNTCADREGGASDCCTTTIMENNSANNSCEFHNPPCVSTIENGITFENIQADGNSHPWHPLNTVIDDATICGENNNQCLETLLEPTDRGTTRVTGLTPVPQGLEYTLTYDVKFDENFEFVKGGKLHGLGPAEHISGCSPLTDTGWSARVMWREEGQLIIYLYHQDKTHNCGHIFRSGVYFTRGQWETVSLYVKVNTAYDVFDGKVQLYLNSQLIAEALDIRFVDQEGWAVPHSEGYIANFMFSAFHGGSNTDWSPSTTQKVYIDNISVTPGHVIPSVVNNTGGAAATTRSGIAKASTVLPKPKSYTGDKLSCEDEGALPFDDDDGDTTTNDDKTTAKTNADTPNLRFGFGGPPPPPGGAGFLRDNSNRISVRLHSEIKLIYEPTSTGAGVITNVLADPAAVTVLQEVTGLYFNRLFSTTNDSAFAGRNAQFSMEDVQVQPQSKEYPIHFIAHVEMDKSSDNGNTSPRDIQRFMTSPRLLNEYLNELKQTPSTATGTKYYGHVQKVVVLVIRHGHS